MASPSTALCNVDAICANRALDSVTRPIFSEYTKYVDSLSVDWSKGSDADVLSAFQKNIVGAPSVWSPSGAFAALAARASSTTNAIDSQVAQSQMMALFNAILADMCKRTGRHCSLASDEGVRLPTWAFALIVVGAVLLAVAVTAGVCRHRMRRGA